MKETLKKVLRSLFEFFSYKVEAIPPGETELDYVPKEEVLKRKRNIKQFSEIKSEQPFVKTRNKPKTKNRITR